VKKELNEMFTRHKAKMRLAEEAEAAEKSYHRELQTQAVAAIESVIGPALQSLSEELKGRGHEADVFLLLSNDSSPSAHLSFRIANDPHGPANASRLSFDTTAAEDSFEVTAEIWGREGREPFVGKAARRESKSIPNVSDAWVKARAVAFVGYVLDRA
jgi:hypothetical protein